MKDWSKRQIGNFIVEKIDMDGMDFVEVRTIGGEWRVMYRADTSMYRLITSLDTLDKNLWESLKVMVTNMMAVSTIVDQEFQHSVFNATSALINRASSEPPLSKEEDDKILEEEKTAYFAKEEKEDSL